MLTTKFEKFHTDNPHIYLLFRHFALEAIKAGRNILSANMIAERIRWETTVTTKGDGYKINNNYRAYYARMFMREHPDLDGCFRVRAVSGEI
jgi:hypothetical protein